MATCSLSKPVYCIRIFIEQLFSFKIYLPETKHMTWCMKDFGTKKLQNLLLASPLTSHVTVGKHLSLTSLSPTVLTLTAATFQEMSFSASHWMLSDVEKHLIAPALGASKHSRWANYPDPSKLHDGVWGVSSIILYESISGDFPGGPVAKIPGSQGRRPRFNPWSGN